MQLINKRINFTREAQPKGKRKAVLFLGGKTSFTSAHNSINHLSIFFQKLLRINVDLDQRTIYHFKRSEIIETCEMNLSPKIESFVMHCGEMGSRWGFNRTIGQIMGLLVMSEEPLSANDIGETLSMLGLLG